jgi:hypothetical protein
MDNKIISELLIADNYQKSQIFFNEFVKDKTSQYIWKIMENVFHFEYHIGDTQNDSERIKIIKEILFHYMSGIIHYIFIFRDKNNYQDVDFQKITKDILREKFKYPEKILSKPNKKIMYVILGETVSNNIKEQLYSKFGDELLSIINNTYNFQTFNINQYETINNNNR